VLDFQDTRSGIVKKEDGVTYSPLLTEIDKLKIIQGAMDSYRRVRRVRPAHTNDTKRGMCCVRLLSSFASSQLDDKSLMVC
jgi:hypothetical protein